MDPNLSSLRPSAAPIAAAAAGGRSASSAPNNNNNNNRPTSARGHPQHQQHQQQQQADLLSAKAALSALQTGVAGERSSSLCLEKQLSVGSDVRAFAVCGADVWMAHADGNITIRDCRTGHALDPAPSPAVYRMQSADRVVGQSTSPWCLLAVAPLRSSSNVNAGGMSPPASSSSSSAVSFARQTVWVGFADGNIEVFDSESRESLGVVPRHHSGGVYCLAHFGNTVFSGSNDFQIGMWDACTRGYLRQFSGHTNYVRCLHAEGALLFSGGDDGTVRVWNTTNGSEISRATFHRKAGVGCLIRVGPDMWSGDNSGDIIVWRLQTMREEHLLKEHTGRITALKKVGRSRVYSAAADRLICVWDAFTHTLLHRVAEHNAWVLSLAFPCSLTRHYVWTGAADATVRCFHHDEFVPMTHALETALEGGWYACDYAPYRDLAEAQGEELRAARDKLKLLFDSERQARERAGHLEMHLDRARAEITEVDTRNHREMEEVALLKRRFADFDRREHELLRQVDAAQQQREEMRQRLEATEAENARLAEAVRAANERVDAARVQSDHMEEILKEAVRAQTEARMQAMGAATATGDARGPLGSPRGGGAVRKAQSPRDGGGPATAAGLNRAASFSASGIGSAGSKYFGGKERPLILVTMGPEYQKVVADFEAEIKDLNEKIARLQRVQTAGIRKAGSGGALRPPSAGAQNQANNAAANPARDWSSQAADILKSRQSQKDLLAMAAGQFVPRPPPNINNNNGGADAAAASSAIFGATVPEW